MPAASGRSHQFQTCWRRYSPSGSAGRVRGFTGGCGPADGAALCPGTAYGFRDAGGGSLGFAPPEPDCHPRCHPSSPIRESPNARLTSLESACVGTFLGVARELKLLHCNRLRCINAWWQSLDAAISAMTADAAPLAHPADLQPPLGTLAVGDWHDNDDTDAGRGFTVDGKALDVDAAALMLRQVAAVCLVGHGPAACGLGARTRHPRFGTRPRRRRTSDDTARPRSMISAPRSGCESRGCRASVSYCGLLAIPACVIPQDCALNRRPRTMSGATPIGRAHEG